MIASDYLRSAPTDKIRLEREKQVEIELANLMLVADNFAGWPTGKIMLLAREIIGMMMRSDLFGKEL